MPLTSQNTEEGHKGRTLRLILTGNDSREVGGKCVPSVPTTARSSK